MRSFQGQGQEEVRLTLEISPSSAGGLEEVVISAAGRAFVAFRPPIGIDQLRSVVCGSLTEDPRDPDRATDGASEASASRLGEVLFGALFSCPVLRHLDYCRGRAGRAGRVVVDLRIDARVRELRWLACLPWEWLKDPDEERFLCEGRKISLVRSLKSDLGAREVPLRLPLRVAVVAPQPLNLGRLDLAREKRLLLEALKNSPDVIPEFLEAVQPQRVREELLEGDFQVLHFMGHGQFDPATGRGSLCFEGPAGSCELVGGRDLERLFADLDDLAFVFLNACHSGRLSERAELDPSAGVAPTLLRRGVPAVVAMQRPVSDEAAILFSEVFYRRLMDEDPLDVAFNEARLALAGRAHLAMEWSTPVLLVGQASGRLAQVVLPAEERAMREGRAALLGDDLPAAEHALRRALAANPSHPGARVHWCLLKMIRKRPDSLTLAEGDELIRWLDSLVAILDVSTRQLAAALRLVLCRDCYRARSLRPVPSSGREGDREVATFSTDSEERRLLSKLRLSRSTAMRLGLYP